MFLPALPPVPDVSSSEPTGASSFLCSGPFWLVTHGCMEEFMDKLLDGRVEKRPAARRVFTQAYTLAAADLCETEVPPAPVA